MFGLEIGADQLIVFTVILFALVLFVTRTLRYDLVSLFALLIVILAGVISVEDAFAGFSHPVIIIVISMFVITAGLSQSGVIEYITRKTHILDKHPVLQIAALTTIVAIASAFINNVGALAPLIPIAIHMARQSKLSPALYLLPLAFGSHLGGYLTLIGTPRNIIVSAFRERAGFEPFGMFDFMYVGSFLTLAGIIFLSLIGWRLLRRPQESASDEPFIVGNYVTEVVVREDSPLIGEYTGVVSQKSKNTVSAVSIIRDNTPVTPLSGYEIIREGDNLLLQADSTHLTEFVEQHKLALVGEKAIEARTLEEETVSLEAVVQPSSLIIGRSWHEIALPLRYGVNLLAVARSGEKIKTSLRDVHFRAGDVLLVHGKKESVEETIPRLGCYPLADRHVTLGRKLSIPLSLAIFITAILTATFTTAPIQIIFLVAAFLMVVLNVIPLKQAYENVEWPLIVLLGSMITIGFALEESGAADTIASIILASEMWLSPAMIVALVLIISMLLSDFVSTTASAVIMAPVAIFLATDLNVSIDPFLMAVAIGASSAYLTAIGHESNILVQETGNYGTMDYIRVGLPLEIIIMIISVPLILFFWPL